MPGPPAPANKEKTGERLNRKERRSQKAAGGLAAGGAQAPARFDQASRLFAQAVQAHQANRLEEAESLYRQVVALDPGQAEAWSYLGVVSQQKGAGAEAIEAFGRAVALRPGSADFVNNLGIAYLKQENFEAAGRQFEKAIALNPWLAQAHYNLGLVLRKQKKPMKAMACFRQAIALVPKYGNAYLSLGNLLTDYGMYDEAAAEFRNLLSFAPNARVVRFNLANTLKAARRYKEAADVAREMLEAEPNDATGHNIMAMFLWSIGRQDEAEASARRAIELDPKLVDAYATLGLTLTAVGRFEEAVECFNTALDLQPDHAEAIQRLTTASKECSTREFAERIERILPQERPPAQTAALEFSLGKIYDDIGDYERAFEHYRAANDIAVPEPQFEPEAWNAIMDRRMAVFTPQYFTARKNFGSESRRPIFIFGMPRSGTTLTEQIIASHPQVAAGGELETFPDLVKKLPKRVGTGTKYPECALEMSAETAQAMAADYLAALDEVSADAPHVTDKVPFNFKDLGLIAALFPKAVFIHCRRDPLDTLLSCYFQNFRRDLDFTFRIEHLAAYYRGYRRIMDHWRKVLPVPMLELDYEELIENQEEVSRRLIAHCGLEWDERCLRFHKTEREVRTSSVWQVRQPIYKSAKRRWKNYEAHLGPLRAALGEYVAEPAAAP